MVTGNGRKARKVATKAPPRVTPKRGWPKGKPRGKKTEVQDSNNFRVRLGEPEQGEPYVDSKLIEEGDPVMIDNEGYVKTAKVKTEQEKDRGNPIFGTIVFNNSQADKDDRTISRRLTDIEQTITNLRSSVERVERTVNRVIDKIG